METAFNTTANRTNLKEEDVFFPVYEEKVRAVSGQALEGVKMIVNRSTGKPLGVVGHTYKPATNEQLFGSMLKTVESLGMRYETNFSSRGAKYFMRVSFPDLQFKRKASVGDITKCEMTVQNSFDGSLRAGIKLAAKRLICSNGCTSGEDIANVQRKHTSGFDPLLMVDAVKGQIEKFSTVLMPFWNAMAEYELDDKARRAVFNRFAPTNKMKKKQARLKASAIFPEKYRDTLLEVYKKPHAFGDVRDNSLYSVYNSFTETATHHIGKEVSPDRLAKYDDAIFRGFASMI